MAKITINEVSQNYTYNIGTNSYATVALPITACWGPGFVDPASLGEDATIDDVLDRVMWKKFPATQSGLESFVSTYRGPSSNYRLCEDFSYQVAMTLMTSGYDVLVCRLAPGDKAVGSFTTNESSSFTGDGSATDFVVSYTDTTHPASINEVSVDGTVKTITTDYTYDSSTGKITFVTAPSEGASIVAKYTGSLSNAFVITAKYPGSFGNNLQVVLKKLTSYNSITHAFDYHYWNVIVYVIDSSGVKTAVENLNFVFEEENATDAILYIDEIESNFISFGSHSTFTESSELSESSVMLAGGTDKPADPEGATGSSLMTAAINIAKDRFNYVGETVPSVVTDANQPYLYAMESAASTIDVSHASNIKYMEWLYKYSLYIYDLLKDKLAYNPQRIIAPGWDDQNICAITGDDFYAGKIPVISPIHVKLMEVAYYSRCACALLDIPKSLSRGNVYDDDAEHPGYAQMLARYIPVNAAGDVNGTLYQTHSALFAPWGQYRYVGTSKQNIASPSFQCLMIMRGMILNQTLQYEWALPTNRSHNIKLGKLDYAVNKKYLDIWQKLEGVGVNVITDIPGLGITVWGNSTLYEVPPATYNALANLSTRYLINAVEDVAYKCGVSITYQYNNQDAYSKFYAGVTPILDTMKNVGAIDDYYVKMAADINGLDQVNANSVIGKIYLVVSGVINDITIDLIALPPTTDLDQFRS